MNRRAALIATLVATAIGLAACGGDDDEGGNETFQKEGYGISFSYPSDFEPGEVEGGQSAGGEVDERTAVSLDGSNGITISRSALGMPVTAANLGSAKRHYDALVAQLAGRPVEGRATEVGGLPALEYPRVDAAGVITRSTLVFDGDTQYQINCQWTDREAEVQDACDLALRTLKRRGG